MFKKNNGKKKNRKNFGHTRAYASKGQMFQFPDENKSIAPPSPQVWRHFGLNTHFSELPHLLVQSPLLFDMCVELPHKDRTAIIFLSSTDTSKRRNELCVNRRHWIKRVAWRRTSSKSEGGSSDTVLCVNTVAGANGTIMLEASCMFGYLMLQKQLCFAFFLCTAINVLAWTSVTGADCVLNTGEPGCSHLCRHREHVLFALFTCHTMCSGAWCFYWCRVHLNCKKLQEASAGLSTRGRHLVVTSGACWWPPRPPIPPPRHPATPADVADMNDPCECTLWPRWRLNKLKWGPFFSTDLWESI